eukprot:TRINITY_DN72030_c0_g1_i1.p2 TRINITY_DN72030_c0_g1~~TRINITY_DN72030_c0_g1_i1.p2  ORF type:complete len:115 (+),score=6.40 TRINITY_DN72030_c0_g1_i1:77-421(+)
MTVSATQNVVTIVVNGMPISVPVTHAETIKNLAPKILYSDKYSDDEYEYRHVTLPREYLKILPQKGMVLMSERQWRSFGIQQSLGWEHYMIHKPEAHILCYRRRLDFDATAAPR